MPLHPESDYNPAQPEVPGNASLVNIDDLEVGLYIDVLDSVNTWSEAKVGFT